MNSNPTKNRFKNKIKDYIEHSFPYDTETFLFLLLSVMVICAVLGFLWEQTYGMIWPDGKIHHGTSFGPWIQIYGFGAVIVFLLCSRLKDKPWLAVFTGAFLCAATEFTTAFVMDHFMNWRAWDYREGPFSIGNINGYVALIPTIAMAFGTAFILYVLVPFLLRVEKKYGTKRVLKIAVLFASVFLLDVIYNDILSGPLGLFNATSLYHTPK